MKQNLLELIVALKSHQDTTRGLEYGDPDRSYMSGVQITYIPTAGGLQYRICRLTSFRQPMASQYTPSPDEAFKIAEGYVKDYTKPNPGLQAIRSKFGVDLAPHNLCWFEVKRDERHFQNRDAELTLDLPVVSGKGEIK